MSRLHTLWPMVVTLALFAALLSGCGSTPTVVSGPLPTRIPLSPTFSPGVEPVTSEPFTSLPPTEPPIETPPTEMPSPTNPPTDTSLPPTSLPTNTPLPPTSPPTDTSLPPTSPSTDTPLPPTTVPALQVLSFTASPTITHNLGDVVHLTWKASGQRAELCPLIGPGPTNCQDVPLAGEQDFVVDEQALTYVGFVLRVYADEATRLKIVELHPQCQNLRQWFFANPPLRCPAQEALTSFAAAQHFERGMMVWIEETDEFYVFYDEPDEQGFQVAHYTVGLELKPGASEDNRVGEDPPPGLYEPVSGFGLVWRGEVEWYHAGDVRERLGWATAPEFGYDTAHQCSTPSYPRLWNCFLLGPDGEVILLRPDSTAGVRILWEEW